MKRLIGIICLSLCMISLFSWEITIEEDIMTDTEKIFLSSLPTSQKGNYGKGAMMFRFFGDTNSMDVYLYFDRSMKSDNIMSKVQTTEIKYRIDQGEVNTTKLIMSSKEGLYWITNMNIMLLVNLTIAKERLIIQGTSYNGTIVQLVFDMSNFGEQYEKFVSLQEKYKKEVEETN